MALLFMDSFDHYATVDLLEKWTTSSATGSNSLWIGSGSGRRGSNSFRWTNSFNTQSVASLQRALAPTGATFVAGFALAVPASHVGAAGLQIAAVRDGATTQLSLRLNANYTISVCRGPHDGTVLGTTTVALTAGTFAYVEWKVLIDPSVGTVAVQINGVSALTVTGVNTRTTANSTWSMFVLGVVDVVANSYNGNNLSIDYDDLYVCDGSGAAPWNTFLGDVRVDARIPTAASANGAPNTGWTPSAGANYACVDETPPNDDTDSTSTTTIGAIDTFVTQDAPVAGATIFGIQHCLNLKKLDAGACSVAPVVRHSGVDYPGAAIAPGTSYAYGLAIAQVNPGTSAQWTEAGFNAAEFGYKRTA